MRLLCSLLLLGATGVACAQEQSADTISREVKDVFSRCRNAVVKVRGMDDHSEIAGTGFFVDPTGILFTAYSVAGEGSNFTVEFNGKKMPARQLVADIRSGVAMLKVDANSPMLPIGRSSDLEVTAPVVTIGFPLDLPQTPSFGLVAGFDRKYLGRYFTTTHLRVNLSTQRGEAGAPLLNMKGEVVGIVVSSLENNSSCYALPIEAAEKIRGDYVRFGEVRHGWIGINVAEAAEEKDGSRAEMTQIMDGTPAEDSGVKMGDMLLQIGNRQIHQPDDVIDASFFLSAGDSVPITVLRDGKKMVFNIQAGFHPNTPAHSIAASLAPPKEGIPLKLQRNPPEQIP
ncbi:MAG: S1C family serine protease [Verrucomicrobiota bacterium]|nr:S1C family serine protease [Verrucomicrobiota bacterium]